MQQQLQYIYEIDVPHNVVDFVTTDQILVSKLTNGSYDHQREKLLVHQSGEELDIMLYLHSDIVARLPEYESYIELHKDNIEDFGLAICGISNFLYLTWNAIHHRSVTLMEMELQSEIDKYILLLIYLLEQGDKNFIDQLRTILFKKIKFDDDLDKHEQKRCFNVNTYADRYCKQFEIQYVDKFGCREMLNELRRFYRFKQEEKLKKIKS